MIAAGEGVVLGFAVHLQALPDDVLDKIILILRE